MPIYKTDIEPDIPSEDIECIDFANYLREKGLKFSHINNEAPAVSLAGRQASGKPIWKKRFKTINRNKALGVNKGVPDYIVIIERKATEMAGPRNNILLFVEMKKIQGGKVSKQQAEWINALNKVFGVVAVVCRGFDEAKNVIDAYVK